MQQQRTYVPGNNGMTNMRQVTYDRNGRTDWSGEISPAPGMRPPLDTGIGGMAEDMPPMRYSR